MNLIEGTVLHGRKRGKILGYPTANLRLNEDIPAGIYISFTNIDDKKYQSITFVGNATTFGEKEIFAETHILDFDNDIYGEHISVKLLKKIRNNEKFTTPENLIKQMEKDKKAALEYFNKNV